MHADSKCEYFCSIKEVLEVGMRSLLEGRSLAPRIFEYLTYNWVRMWLWRILAISVAAVLAKDTTLYL